MFFADKIKSILPGDTVLEIGPGANPHPRSNILLEKKFKNDAEYAAQFGHNEKLVTDKQIVFYEGNTFPFKDKEFDYVICSHVLEHVEDVPQFLKEVFRVSAKGYFEYPLVYYEYLYNFDVHLNLLKYRNGIMYYLPKNKTPFNEFKPIQDFYYQSLQKGHVQIINDLLDLMMEGFEWQSPFELKEVKTIAEVCHINPIVEAPRVKENKIEEENAKQLIKKLIKKIIK